MVIILVMHYKKAVMKSQIIGRPLLAASLATLASRLAPAGGGEHSRAPPAEPVVGFAPESKAGAGGHVQGRFAPDSKWACDRWACARALCARK